MSVNQMNIFGIFSKVLFLKDFSFNKRFAEKLSRKIKTNAVRRFDGSTIIIKAK